MKNQHKARMKNAQKQAEETIALFDEALNGEGHNSTREKLRQVVARIERLEDEKSAISLDIKEIYEEAKSFGFDVPALRAVIKRRKANKEQLEAQQLLIETYEGVVEGRQLELFSKAQEQESDEEENYDPETGEIIEPEEDEDFDDEEDDGFEDIDED